MKYYFEKQNSKMFSLAKYVTSLYFPGKETNIRYLLCSLFIRVIGYKKDYHKLMHSICILGATNSDKGLSCTIGQHTENLCTHKHRSLQSRCSTVLSSAFPFPIEVTNFEGGT